MAENTESQEMLMDTIEDSYFTATVNAYYWPRLYLKYYRHEKRVKVFLAVIALASVAGWAGSLVSSLGPPWDKRIQVSWRAFSILSATIAFILPILDWAGKIQSATKLSENWITIQREYDRLWINISQMYSDEVRKQFDDIKDMELLVSKTGLHLPHTKKRLIKQCENEVRKLRVFS